MSHQQPGYRAYLLRLWQVQQADEYVWRASLEDAETHDLLGFCTLQELCEFIKHQCKDRAPPNCPMDTAEEESY